jgi:hypothetical protein
MDEDYPLSDTEFTGITLAEGLKELRVAGGNPRFLGKSSGMTLVQAAMDFKREYSGNRAEGPDVLGTTISDRRREEFWMIPDVCITFVFLAIRMSNRLLQWESVSIEEHHGAFDFPPEDLFRSLVDLYFQHVNPFTPLLHRLTFERQYAEGKHHNDRAFASTVLLLCACASRWSNDPRCLVDGVNKHSAGWMWFERAQSFRRNALMSPSLHDLQVYAVSMLINSFDIKLRATPVVCYFPRWHYSRTCFVDDDWNWATISSRCWRSSTEDPYFLNRSGG